MSNEPQMSLWDFLYRLIHGKWWALPILVLVVAATPLGMIEVGMRIVQRLWPGDVEIRSTAGTIRFVKKNRQYAMQLVHPFGWQTTGVHFEGGQTASVSASGRVTVGYVEQFWSSFCYRASDKCFNVRDGFVQPLDRCLAERVEGKRPPLPRWPWVGPEGYSPKMYASPEYKSAPYDGKEAKGIMVEGIPHGTLVGCIRPEGEEMSPEEIVSSSEVFVLGRRREITAKKAGILWVGVNDAGPYFHDNLGFFSLSVVTPAPED